MKMKTQSAVEYVKPAKGDVIDGVLLEMESKTIDGETRIGYRVEERSGDNMEFCTGRTLEFLQTGDLKNKLRNSAVGHYIHVEKTGEDQRFARNGTAMSVFKVQVSEDLATPGREIPKNAHGVAVTDDDIPFDVRAKHETA